MQLFQTFKKALKEWGNYSFFCEYRFRNIVRRHLRKSYTSDAPRAKNERRQVIVLFDDRCTQPGFADRLRGIVTVYDYCKEHELDFRIHFTAPFRLEEYLEPVVCDWRIDDDAISYNEKDACAVLLGNYAPWGEREMAFQKRLTRRFLASRRKQIHVYANIFYAEERFGKLFNELFRPTAALQRELDKQTAKLGGDGRYIAVSTRFLELLGDIDQQQGEPARKLSEAEQEALIARCCVQIERMRDAHPEGVSVLVTSDSARFLSRAAKLEQVHVLPGESVPADAEGGEHTGMYAGMLLGFLTLSRACEVNLLVSGPMYRSNFSRRAAQVHDRPFQEVFF